MSSRRLSYECSVTLNAELAAQRSDGAAAACRDALKATVCTNCHQFLQMQEEDMEEHLQGIVRTVWALLIGCGPRRGQDNLAMAAMAFLTTVCRSTYHKLFGSGDTIKQVRSRTCASQPRAAA